MVCAWSHIVGILLHKECCRIGTCSSLALDAQDFDTVMTVTALACTGEVRDRVSQAAHSKLFKKYFLNFLCIINSLIHYQLIILLCSYDLGRINVTQLC